MELEGKRKIKRRYVVIILMIILILPILLNTRGIDDGVIFSDLESESIAVQEAVVVAYKSGYMVKIQDGNFKPQDPVTIGQALKVLSRMLGQDERDYRDVGTRYGVLEPSDMVYNRVEWENMWKKIMKGGKVFEEVDGKYRLTVIPKYFRVDLNERGYQVITKGMLPQQLSMYTPFVGIEGYTEEFMATPATKGFVNELMLVYIETELGGRVLKDQRREELSNLLKESLEEEGKEGQIDRDKYNYYAISYGGQLLKAKQIGLEDKEVLIDRMNESITRAEMALKINKAQEILRGLKEE